MRDALGGIVNIQFILIFIVLVSSYLAFSVNYTKAFRAKNRVIDIYEAYDGELENEGAQRKINTYLKKIGYNPAKSYITAMQNSCGNNCECQNGYCIKRVAVDNKSGLNREYAEVTTMVSIDFPILNQLLPHVGFFKIQGSTKTIYVNN